MPISPPDGAEDVERPVADPDTGWRSYVRPGFLVLGALNLAGGSWFLNIARRLTPTV